MGMMGAGVQLRTLRSYLDPFDRLTSCCNQYNAHGAASDGCRYPAEDANKSNVSIIVTNVGADFTSLGSFNPPMAFGNLMLSMPDHFPLHALSWSRLAFVGCRIQDRH